MFIILISADLIHLVVIRVVTAPIQRPPTGNGPVIAKDRVARRVRRILDAATRAPHCDYNKLHSCLYSLEKELVSYNMNGAGKLTANISSHQFGHHRIKSKV